MNRSTVHRPPSEVKFFNQPEEGYRSHVRCSNLSSPAERPRGFASPLSSSSSSSGHHTHSNQSNGMKARFDFSVSPLTNHKTQLTSTHFYPYSNPPNSMSRRPPTAFTSLPSQPNWPAYNGKNSRAVATERSSYLPEPKPLPRSRSLSKVTYFGFDSPPSGPRTSTYRNIYNQSAKTEQMRAVSPSKRSFYNLPQHLSRLSTTTSTTLDRNSIAVRTPSSFSRPPAHSGESRARRMNGHEDHWTESRNNPRLRDESPAGSHRRSQASSTHRSPSPVNGNNHLTSATTSFNQRTSNTTFRHPNSSSPLFPSSPSAGLVGLTNLGNTCFMNSVIQCLSNTWNLLHVCLDPPSPELNINSSMKGNLFTAYADLIRQMWCPSSTSPSSSSSNTSGFSSSSPVSLYVSPQRFKSQIQKFAPRFMGYAQQDAQEFLRYLVQGLHEDVNRVKKRPPSEIPDYDKEDRLLDSEKAALYWQRYKRIDDSPISDLFMGQLMSTLTCMSCGYMSTTFDPFWDLSLPIPRGNNVNIKDCFDLFTSKEILDGAEQPTCGGCKKRQPCRKSFSIQRFPNVLVIHFKRFSGERSRSKLTTFIDYPIEHLDLNQYASICSPERNASYRLYGVSNHSGNVFGGHYTAYCRNPKLETWFEYNDSRVRSISKSEAVSSEAYVLFYERMDGQLS